MNNQKNIWKFIIFVLAVLSISPLYAFQKEVEATMSLAALFHPSTSLESGIKGSVNSGGKIEVTVRDKNTNTIVFQVAITSTSTEFSGTGINYNK